MSARKYVWALNVAAVVGMMLTGVALGADGPADVARKADEILRSEAPYANAAKASPGRIDDERFLRRASLDIIGRLPTPEETTAFSLDPAADKRASIVEKLLASPQYGENWGRYWRDVIMYRKTEDRSGIITGPLQTYLTESFNSNKLWSQIATEFITAEGDATENGACGLIVAQQGQPEEVTSEVSRIFLGVQLSCAQCHDHPTDRWKREQFHQLTAFFPRVSSRIILRMGEEPQITVAVNDMAFGGRFRGPMNRRFAGTPEHYMSDLKNPQSRGTLMTPVLFATGQTLPLGTRDADRRGTLAEWITAKDNPYFSQAFVNRMWSELTGEGFYEPVDDMGPDRTAVAPQTLEYLAKEFADSGYDIKRLFQTIMATDLYQTPSAPRRGPEDPPMQHNVAQRLRADVLFDNLLVALEASEPPSFGGGRGGLYRGAFGPRGQFNTAFGYDPSVRRDEVQSSIPQALAMMNSTTISAALRGTGQTMLARQLREIKDDKALTQELYLRVFGREPTESELTTVMLYLKQVGNRTEAFEDVLWGLVNSAEFLHRT
jgi:hypothetical protein